MFEVLSQRELDVARYAMEGLTDKEIAARLDVGVETVRTYWKRIRRKTGVGTRSEAVARIARYTLQEEIKASQAQSTGELVRDRAVVRSDASTGLPYDLVFDAVPVALAIVRADGQILRVNSAFARAHGFTASELYGISIQRLRPSEGLQSARAVHRRKDGTRFVADAVWTAIPDERVRAFVGCFQPLADGAGVPLRRTMM